MRVGRARLLGGALLGLLGLAGATEGGGGWRGAASPWATLELPETGASEAEVKRAFRDLALRHHPDKGGDPAYFISLRAAFDELSSEEGRARWLPGSRFRGEGGEGAWEDVLGDLVFRTGGVEGKVPREAWEKYAEDPSGMFEGLFGGGQKLSVNFINKDGKAYAQHEFTGRVRKGPGRRLGGGAGAGALDGDVPGGGLQESPGGAQPAKRGQSLKFKWKKGRQQRSEGDL